MELVGGHTFEESLLGDGCIIDIGCRGFEFTKYFIGRKVYCIDPDPEVFKNIPEELMNLDPPMIALNMAISDTAGESEYYENGEATCLKQLHHFQDHRIKPCKTITMEDLYKITGENVDLLKLDCEGAEYIILGETFKPIPKQISVEFHNHCVPEIHARNYRKIVERLSEHYTMHNDVWEQRHGCGFNFWDTLFIKK
jgi:FkbM family methyltransferase